MLSPEVDSPAVLRELSDAEGHLTTICFKTGPPELTGVELEWTVHDASDPSRPVDPDRLRRALGPYAPTTLDPAGAHLALAHQGTITVEPGGQVEISTVPHHSLAALFAATGDDTDRLRDLLRTAGLVLGTSGIDPYRPPRPCVDTLATAPCGTPSTGVARPAGP
ncbi:hypothetical protein GCM10027605_42750 [Micromonospora zhanjiangensis]